MHTYEMVTYPSRGKPRHLIVKVNETTRVVVAECSNEHYAKLLIGDLAQSNVNALMQRKSRSK